MALWNKQEQTTPQKGGASSASPTPAIEPAHEEGTPMSVLKRDDLSTTPPGTGDLLLGHGAEFEGKLTFAGTVRMDAKFKGSIVTDDVLVVGEHATVEADITCGTVTVYGEVIGNIKAKVAVELHPPARVRGDIETPSLSIEKGVVFQGHSSMTGVPRIAPPRSANGTRDVSITP